MLQKNRSTGHNRRLAQWRVKWLIEHSTSHQLLWCIESFVLRNPPLRQAPKRYASLKKNPIKFSIIRINYYFDKKSQDKTMSTIFGNRIRTLREEQQIPQRQLASILEIDTSTYCKIEKGDRRAKREQVSTLAKILKTDRKELLRLWSADKVYDLIADEDEATQILNVVAENISIYKHQKTKI